MTTIIKVKRVVGVSNNPEDYILHPPKGHDPDAWKAEKIMRCPYGPLVLWVPNCRKDGDCPACEGSAELEAQGADGTWYDVECPKCDGTGEVEVDAEPETDEPGVWTDPDGNVLDIVLNVGDGEGPWPNPLWVRDWVQAQQAPR